MKRSYLPWEKVTFEDRPCIRDDHAVLSYGQLARRIDALAAQLSEEGIGYGDVVALMMPPRSELAIGIFAAWRLAAAVTVIDPHASTGYANAQVIDAEACLLLTAADTPELDMPTIRARDFATELGSRRLPHNDVVDDELALIVYGNTALPPKGVMLSHGNLSAMSCQMIDRFHAVASDHSVHMNPAFHDGSAIVGFLATIMVGAQMTITESSAPEVFLSLLGRLRPTHVAASKTFYEKLAAELPAAVAGSDSLRVAFTGSMDLPAALASTLEERLGLVMVKGYGRAEGTFWSACQPLDEARKPETAGQVFPGQRVRIVDTCGNDLPPGVTGEVLVSGPTVMQGYVGRHEETRRTIVDGWLHTGDVGSLDQDGYLTLTGVHLPAPAPEAILDDSPAAHGPV